MNVDIFACVNFRESMKMDNFAYIKMRVLSITGSLGYLKSNVQGYIFSRIFKKWELRENMYSVKISTFTVPLIVTRGGSRGGVFGVRTPLPLLGDPQTS